MSEGYGSRPVCLSVCLSVTALAATVSVYACNQRHPQVSLRPYLILNLWNSSVQELRSEKANMQMSWSSPRAVFAHFLDQELLEGRLVGRILLQRLAAGATGVKQARSG